MSEPAVKTTVVGSYPVPSWLAAYPSTPNLHDALMVILKTQELAGLDVIADGELSRFDISHPETNGMIEYFISPMEGITTQMSREDLAAFRAQEGMGFRTQPAGIVRDKIREGTLNLPAAWQMIKPLSDHTLKFTVTAPYMLAKTLVDEQYGDLQAMTMDIAEVLRKQVEERAYALWESEGKPHGRDLDHWRQAESEIMTAGDAEARSNPPSAAASPASNKKTAVDSKA